MRTWEQYELEARLRRVFCDLRDRWELEAGRNLGEQAQKMPDVLPIPLGMLTWYVPRLREVLTSAAKQNASPWEAYAWAEVREGSWLWLLAHTASEALCETGKVIACGAHECDLAWSARVTQKQWERWYEAGGERYQGRWLMPTLGLPSPKVASQPAHRWPAVLLPRLGELERAYVAAIWALARLSTRSRDTTVLGRLLAVHALLLDILGAVDAYAALAFLSMHKDAGDA